MSFVQKMRTAALCASSASIVAVPSAFAGNVDKKSSDIIRAILDIIYHIALYIGIFLLVWSIVMLVLALKNEDADSKSRAIMLIAVSIALIGIGTFAERVVNMVLK